MTESLRAACMRAVHVVRKDGTLLAGGRAVLYILGHIGFPLLATVLSIPPLVWLVEGGYRIVARNRRFFAKFLFRREADPPTTSRTS